MRGAIIGFGTIAMGHAKGYTQTEKIAMEAIVDPTPERRLCAERDFGLRAYATLEDMLASETPDFIDICTPPDTHAHYMKEGLRNGLHVLCEKPVFVPTEDDYEVLLKEILEAETIVYPSHNYKFAPILELMEKVVRAPEFGKVLNARFRTLRKGHAVGVPEWNPHWRRDPDTASGGILRDHGPHSIYLATHLTGRTPVAVSCITGNLRKDAGATASPTEDTALLTVRCDDDVQIVLDVSWAASYRNSYYSITGSAGSVVVENDDVQYTVGGEVIRTTLSSDFDDPSHTSWFGRMFLDFLDMVENRHRQPALLHEALMTSQVIDAAYRSADLEGQWVDIDQPGILNRAL